MRRPAPRINALGFSLFVWLSCLARIYWPCAAAQAVSHPPNIIQLLTFSNERIIALTEDKRGLFYSTDAGRKWRQPANLPDAYLYSVSADADGNLFLTTSSGILRSQDGGANWSHLSDLKAALVVFAPDDAGALCKIWGKGLFRTSPGYFSETEMDNKAQVAQERAELKSKINEAWTELMRLRDMPESSPEKRELLHQYRRWQTLQEQDEKLRESGKAGLSEVVGLPEAPVRTAIFRSQSEAFAGFFGQGIYRSTDGGKTWQEANNGLSNRHLLTLAASPEGKIYAGTYGGGLFHYSDRSRSWSLLKTGLKDGIVQCIAFAPSGLMMIGARREGVLLSRDQGQTWSRSTQALPGANIQSLAVGSDGVLYAGAYEKGLFVSRDEGRTWGLRSFAYLSYVKQVAADVSGLWYVDVKGIGLLKSFDKGQSWDPVELPFPYHPSFTLAVGDGGLLVAGTLESAVHVSQDQGENWQKLMTGLTGKGVHALRGSPAGEVYAASSEGNALCRLAHGFRWEKIVATDENGGDYTCWDVVFLPDSEAVAYGYNDILISRDQFQVWQRTRFGQAFEGLWLDLHGRIWTKRMLSTFFLADDSEWKESSDLPKDRYTQFARLNDGLYAAVRMGGGVDVLRWTGSALEFVRKGLEDKMILGLAADRENTILAGSETGLWASGDFGESWHEIEVQY